MKLLSGTGMIMLVLFAAGVQAQVSPRDINGARNTPGIGTSLDTNVNFSLRMTLNGDTTLRESAILGQDVKISAVIHPETEDLGKTADVYLVDLLPPVPYMRDSNNQFVPWDGNPRSLVPFMEGVSLTDNLDVDVFSGQLGATGLHRIYIAFLVGNSLYFTPSALKITIQDKPAEPTPQEQALALFETSISPQIIQGRCIVCHVSRGIADNPSSPVFARTSYPDHLNYNFQEMVWLKGFRSSNYILNKVLGFSHDGGRQLLQGSADFNNLVAFLDLLDQAGQ